MGAGLEDDDEGLLLDDAGVVNGFVALFPKKLETAALDAGAGFAFELVAVEEGEAGDPTPGLEPRSPDDVAPETAGFEGVLVAAAGFAGVATERVLDFEMTTS